MEACIDPGPTRNRRSLASRRLQTILGLDFAAQGTCRKDVGQQRIARTPWSNQKPSFVGIAKASNYIGPGFRGAGYVSEGRWSAKNCANSFSAWLATTRRGVRHAFMGS